MSILLAFFTIGVVLMLHRSNPPEPDDRLAGEGGGRPRPTDGGPIRRGALTLGRCKSRRR
jgi:hypothetical protein